MKPIIEIAASIGIYGFLHPDEFHKLIELAAGRDVLEIGSFRGLSAYGMAWTARKLTCVDTFQAGIDGQRQSTPRATLADFVAATSRFNNVKYLIGTSLDAAANKSLQDEFDLIFIDAMHDYENVKTDIVRWCPRVRKGGMLALHDYYNPQFPGVTRAADEMFGPALGGTTCCTLRWIEKT